MEDNWLKWHCVPARGSADRGCCRCSPWWRRCWPWKTPTTFCRPAALCSSWCGPCLWYPAVPKDRAGRMSSPTPAPQPAIIVSKCLKRATWQAVPIIDRIKTMVRHMIVERVSGTRPEGPFPRIPLHPPHASWKTWIFLVMRSMVDSKHWTQPVAIVNFEYFDTFTTNTPFNYFWTCCVFTSFRLVFLKINSTHFLMTREANLSC